MTIDWSQRHEFVCTDCGARFEYSERVARARLTGETTSPPRCELCRSLDRIPAPTPEDFQWWRERLAPAQLEKLLADVSLLRP